MQPPILTKPHGCESNLERHGLSAIWLNPVGELRDAAPGVSRVLQDIERLAPESQGKWFVMGEENGIDPETIASSIYTQAIEGIKKADGSPVFTEGTSGQAFFDGDPDNYEIENSIGNFSLHGNTDRPERQMFDLILHKSNFSLLSELVRSTAKHLHPDYISASNNTFIRDMLHGRTASWRELSLVGLVSWVRGLDPKELAGYPVVNVEEYEDGLYFEAASDQAGTTLARLADHLEHIGTRQRLGLPPKMNVFVWPDRIDRIPLDGNPDFQGYVAGLVLPEDGSPLPTYVIKDPHGQDLAFHGHVWRSVPDAAGQPRAQEVYLTAMGGFPANLPQAIIEGWSEQAIHQLAAIPTEAWNEWHLDNEQLADRLRQHFHNQQIPTQVYFHNRPHN